jgi:two-component system, OmpR family, sensor histidine kinase BaeS
VQVQTGVGLPVISMIAPQLMDLLGSPMRLRLVHTLSLLLLSAVLLSVLAMGGVMAWNLRSGFADYLASRDTELLTRFATYVEGAVERAGGIDALTQRRLRMRELMDGFALDQGLQPQFRSEPPRESGPPSRDNLDDRQRRGPPPGRSDSFSARVIIVDLDQQVLLGRSPPPYAQDYRDQPIRHAGKVIAFARLRSGEPVPDDVEERFLRSQYVGIVSVSAALFMLALICAWWLARLWARPLLAVTLATQRIARGEFNVRLTSHLTADDRQDEIGNLVRNVNQMAEGLQRLESARRRWVADISHELRTPLAVLRGEIEALVDGIRPLRTEAVLSLKEEVLKLGALVDDLHLLAMSDLEALPCHFVEEDAVQIVQAIRTHFSSRAEGAGLVLSFKTPATMTIPVVWDRARIEQLLGNLLENSLRYTDAPGHIVLSVEQSGLQVIIHVADSAPSVAATDLPRLFEPLYRADAARSRHRGGSGLGLAICDAIARSHSGRIYAEQSQFGGLDVVIELPARAGAGS